VAQSLPVAGKSATPLTSTLHCLTLLPYLIAEPSSAGGFFPEPAQGALITGLLDVVASAALPATELALLGSERLAALIGDTCIVSLLLGSNIEPLAVADASPEAAPVLAPLVGKPIPAGQRHALDPYIARFGLAAEFIAPMRARGRVVGQVVALRRGTSQPYTPIELRLIQSVADVLALGLDEKRVGAQAPGPAAPDNLSHREREILALLALGHTNREIAEQVRLSVRTIEWHRARIQAKLGVTGRAALAQIARTHGLLAVAGVDDDRED
jgi:DNA-binding CsgD family transcriptional regulator